MDNKILREVNCFFKNKLNLCDPTTNRLCKGNLARHKEILKYNKSISTNPENQLNIQRSKAKRSYNIISCGNLTGINLDLESYNIIPLQKANPILESLGLGVGCLGLGMVMVTSFFTALGTLATALTINYCNSDMNTDNNYEYN